MLIEGIAVAILLLLVMLADWFGKVTTATDV